MQAIGWLLVVVAVLAGGCTNSSSWDDPERADGPKVFEIREIQIRPVSDESEANRRPIATTDQFVVSVLPNGSVRSSRVRVKLISLAEGQAVAVKEKVVAAREVKPQEFLFKSEDPWVPGRYLIELSIDGRLASNRDFDVIELGKSGERPQR